MISCCCKMKEISTCSLLSPLHVSWFFNFSIVSVFVFFTFSICCFWGRCCFKFGSLLLRFCSIVVALAPFLHPLDPFLHPLDAFWLPFGTLLAPFWLLVGTPCANFACRGPHNCLKLISIQRPGVEFCRRQFVVYIFDTSCIFTYTAKKLLFS